VDPAYPVNKDTNKNKIYDHLKQPHGSVVNKTATVKTKTETSEHNVNITEAQICIYVHIRSYRQIVDIDKHCSMIFILSRIYLAK